SANLGLSSSEGGASSLDGRFNCRIETWANTALRSRNGISTTIKFRKVVMFSSSSVIRERLRRIPAPLQQVNGIQRDQEITDRRRLVVPAGQQLAGRHSGISPTPFPCCRPLCWSWN